MGFESTPRIFASTPTQCCLSLGHLRPNLIVLSILLENINFNVLFACVRLSFYLHTPNINKLVKYFILVKHNFVIALNSMLLYNVFQYFVFCQYVVCIFCARKLVFIHQVCVLMQLCFSYYFLLFFMYFTFLFCLVFDLRVYFIMIMF